jgi:hypothetical protein
MNLIEWWDALLSIVEQKMASRPVILSLLKMVQLVGEQLIPVLASELPSGLDTKGLVDWLFSEMEKEVANPMEKFALQVINSIIDALLDTIAPPPLPTVL